MIEGTWSSGPAELPPESSRRSQRAGELDDGVANNGSVIRQRPDGFAIAAVAGDQRGDHD